MLMRNGQDKYVSAEGPVSIRVVHSQFSASSLSEHSFAFNSCASETRASVEAELKDVK